MPEHGVNLNRACCRHLPNAGGCQLKWGWLFVRCSPNHWNHNQPYSCALSTHHNAQGYSVSAAQAPAAGGGSIHSDRQYLAGQPPASAASQPETRIAGFSWRSSVCLLQHRTHSHARIRLVSACQAAYILQPHALKSQCEEQQQRLTSRAVCQGAFKYSLFEWDFPLCCWAFNFRRSHESVNINHTYSWLCIRWYDHLRTSPHCITEFQYRPSCSYQHHVAQVWRNGNLV